jgi:hypothetical protein
MMSRVPPESRREFVGAAFDRYVQAAELLADLEDRRVFVTGAAD